MIDVIYNYHSLNVRQMRVKNKKFEIVEYETKFLKKK